MVTTAVTSPWMFSRMYELFLTVPDLLLAGPEKYYSVKPTYEWKIMAKTPLHLLLLSSCLTVLNTTALVFLKHEASLKAANRKWWNISRYRLQGVARKKKEGERELTGQFRKILWHSFNQTFFLLHIRFLRFCFYLDSPWNHWKLKNREHLPQRRHKSCS